MTAADYPVTTPYGYVPGYPLNNGFHKGEDRAMPIGTRVLVNGTEIGLSGTNSGPGSGPHLHIGRWVMGVSTNPNGGGFTVSGAVVTEVDPIGVDPTNGKFVRVQDADGSSWVYLHLSAVKVVKGQVLGMYNGKTAEQWARDCENATNVANQRLKWLDETANQLGIYQPDEVKKQAETITRIKELQAAQSATYVQVLEPLFKQVKK